MVFQCKYIIYTLSKRINYGKGILNIVSLYFLSHEGAGEYNLLCESLGCRTAKEFSNLDWMIEDVHRNSVKMNVNCTGIVKMDNLWQCVDSVLPSCKNPAVVICEGTKHARPHECHRLNVVVN